MVIALERYIIPMISKNQETSYRSALVRICTSLTKGWFRQFTIDNYPRLSNLDKDLLPIAQDIIDNHPLARKEQEVPSTLLHKWIPDPDTRAIFEPIHSCTEKIHIWNRPDLGYDNIVSSGIEITSPVNKDVSITAVITTKCNVHDGCRPGAKWGAVVVIFPSEELNGSS